jgi:hypothetical protein
MTELWWASNHRAESAAPPKATATSKVNSRFLPLVGMTKVGNLKADPFYFPRAFARGSGKKRQALRSFVPGRNHKVRIRDAQQTTRSLRLRSGQALHSAVAFAPAPGGMTELVGPQNAASSALR